ncbi:hypothetical protein [Aeromonas schubertii]
MKVIEIVRARGLALSVAVASAVPALAMAEGADRAGAITAAINAGKADYGLVTAGVITVAALGFAVGMIVSWLKR